MEILGNVTINVKQSDNIWCKIFLHPFTKALHSYERKDWIIKIEEWRLGFEGMFRKLWKLSHLALRARWCHQTQLPAASLGQTWAGQIQSNLQHSHSSDSKLIWLQKSKIIWYLTGWQLLLFREADNHYQLSGISLFLYFSLEFVNWISLSGPILPPVNGHVYIIQWQANQLNETFFRAVQSKYTNSTIADDLEPEAPWITYRAFYWCIIMLNSYSLN